MTAPDHARIAADIEAFAQALRSPESAKAARQIAIRRLLTRHDLADAPGVSLIVEAISSTTGAVDLPPGFLANAARLAEQFDVDVDGYLDTSAYKTWKALSAIMMLLPAVSARNAVFQVVWNR